MLAPPTVLSTPVMEMPVEQLVIRLRPEMVLPSPEMEKQSKPLAVPSTITPAPAPSMVSPLPLRSGSAEPRVMVVGGGNWTGSKVMVSAPALATAALIASRRGQSPGEASQEPSASSALVFSGEGRGGAGRGGEEGGGGGAGGAQGRPKNPPGGQGGFPYGSSLRAAVESMVDADAV